MQRWIPPLALLLLAIMLLLIFGPNAYRAWQLRRTVNSMLDSGRSGDIASVAAHMLPEQQQQFQLLLETFVPEGYEQQIESLSLARIERAGPGASWVLVNCRLRNSAGPAIYQGRLLWLLEDGQWRWDALSSLGAPLSPSGEPQWIELSEIIRGAGGAFD